jgi:hypothetical protein
VLLTLSPPCFPPPQSSQEDRKKEEAAKKGECRMYVETFPEVDDVVMVQVKSIAEMGAYVQAGWPHLSY